MQTNTVAGKPKEISLRRWRVMEAETKEGTRTRHVWGHDVVNNLGRASSAIMQFDHETMTATTRSGSTYQLVGLPGNSRLGKHAWTNRCIAHGIVAETDITDEYLNIAQVSTVEFARINNVAINREEA